MSLSAKRLMTFCLLLATALAAQADQPPPAPKPPARVMLLGLFHFDNPGLDAVRYQPLDVMQPAEQAYLVALSERLGRFAPTRILLEYPDRSDAAINGRFVDFVSGKFDLPKNEIYQLGFRIARIAGHARVYGFDADTPAFDAALWGYLPKEPATERMLMALIASESARLARAHSSMSLREILAMSNSAQEDRRNKGFYMLLNDVAAQTRQFHGADATANWWHRNIRMYALVQMHAKPGERVLVIAGSGHTAVLRDFLRADGDRVEEDVLPYF
jgi:hypothetical protein